VRTSRASRRGGEHRRPRRARPVGARGSQLPRATNPSRTSQHHCMISPGARVDGAGRTPAFLSSNHRLPRLPSSQKLSSRTNSRYRHDSLPDSFPIESHLVQPPSQQLAIAYHTGNAGCLELRRAHRGSVCVVFCGEPPRPRSRTVTTPVRESY